MEEQKLVVNKDFFDTEQMDESNYGSFEYVGRRKRSDSEIKFDNQQTRKLFHLIGMVSPLEQYEKDLRENSVNKQVDHIDPGIYEILSCVSNWMQWGNACEGHGIRIREPISFETGKNWNGCVDVKADSTIDECVRSIIYVKLVWDMIMHKMAPGDVRPEEGMLHMDEVVTNVCSLFNVVDSGLSERIRSINMLGDSIRIVFQNSFKVSVITVNSLLNLTPIKLLRVGYQMRVDSLLPNYRMEANSRKPRVKGLFYVIKPLIILPLFAIFGVVLCFVTLKRLDSIIDSCGRTRRLDKFSNYYRDGLRVRGPLMLAKYFVMLGGLVALSFFNVMYSRGTDVRPLWSFSSLSVAVLLAGKDDVTGLMGRTALKTVLIRDYGCNRITRVVMKYYDRAFSATLYAGLSGVCFALPESYYKSIALVFTLYTFTLVVGIEVAIIAGCPSILFTRIRLKHGNLILRNSDMGRMAFNKLSATWRQYIKETVLSGRGLCIILGENPHYRGKTKHTHMVMNGGFYRKAMPLHMPIFAESLGQVGREYERRVEIEAATWNMSYTNGGDMEDIIDLGSKMSHIKKALCSLVGRASRIADEYQSDIELDKERVHYITDDSGEVVITGDCALVWLDSKVRMTDALSSTMRMIGLLKENGIIENHIEQLREYRERVGTCTSLHREYGVSTMRIPKGRITNDNCVNPMFRLTGPASEVTVVNVKGARIYVLGMMVGQVVYSAVARNVEVFSFLGSTSWCREFVPHFFKFDFRLSEMLRKNSPAHFDSPTPAQRKAFSAINALIISIAALRVPDLSVLFNLKSTRPSLALGVSFFKT